MAVLSYYLDVRYTQKNGKHSLKLRISAKGKKVYLPLGENFTFDKDEWDAEMQMVRPSVKKFRDYNRYLLALMDEYEDKIEKKFEFKDPDAQEVFDVITGRDELPAFLRGETKKKVETSKTLRALFERHIEDKKERPKSAESYAYTLRLLEHYLGAKIDSLTFDRIDYEWLENFRRWLRSEGKLGTSNNKKKGEVREASGLSVNSTAIHLENLRAVNNLAKHLKLTDNYAFDGYTIAREETRKYVMGFGELRKLWAYQPQSRSEEYHLDMFKIIFGLCGINAVDLSKLTEENLVGERVEFYRQKTGVFGNLRIEPEIRELMNKHKGKDGKLVDIADRYGDSDNFLSKMNKVLKTIGDWHIEGSKHKKVYDKVYWPKISSYTARRSWASAAGMEDVAFDTIDMGLTHKGLTMADVYVQRFWHKLDVANRRVLDVVLGIAEPTYEESLDF